MLNARVTVLGVLVLLAGCLGQGVGEEISPGDVCILGGPPRDPPENRSAFPLNQTHALDHPRLAQVFSEEGASIEVDCQDGHRLMEHLREEGADVQHWDRPHGYDVYVRHNGTTKDVGLRLRA